MGAYLAVAAIVMAMLMSISMMDMATITRAWAAAGEAA
jgi:hypothetical protein